jgi:hypothetical protein
MAKRETAGAVRPANPYRGEISVTLDGAEFVLRPDFDAILAIDEALGGITALARRGLADLTSMTLSELAVVITEGIKAHGRSTGSSNAHAGVDNVKRMIFKAGIPTVLPAVGKFLAAAVTGGVEAGNVQSPEG